MKKQSHKSLEKLLSPFTWKEEKEKLCIHEFAGIVTNRQSLFLMLTAICDS